MTAAEPSQARAFLEQWRPLADEVVVAVDERAHPETTNECARLADRVYVVPAAMAHMERYLGWLHSRCSGEWILRADDDELPSEALKKVLRPLLDEREPTHYWLPRSWMYPTPETYITEGIWHRDIQLRLVRNLPGLWRFSGRLHSNVEVAGAGRIVDAPLLHLALLVSDLEKRRAKVEAYERVAPGLRAPSGVPLNSVFVPEEMGVTSLDRSSKRDVAGAARYLQVAREPGEEPAPKAGGVPTVALEEIVRWNGERPVSTDAYRVRVTLPRGIRPMRAESVQHVQVEVANLGDEWLPRGPRPEPPIQVGYRWWREDGTEIVQPTLRTPFTETVAPGATTRLAMAIQAPPDHGRLQLRVDVVHENVRWFECEERLEVDISPPYAEGFFASLDEGGRASADAVIPWLFEHLAPRSIVDVGCGTGTWLGIAREKGIDDVFGLDGPWVSPDALEIPPERFLAADLTVPPELGRTFDLVLSLEVAEHLPPAKAEGFVDCLTSLGPLVVFSAAIPGQGGIGHTNEQWPEYWSELFARRGYEPVDCLREVFWDDEGVDWWYAQNLLLFASPAALDAVPSLREHPSRGQVPRSLVHPRRLSLAP
ncbi:MAG TPA: class I SAM-dependent methyltransferase [Solirubrobacterales bacterium]|nr:class I SAM-dependent methyltransferase [Solirubrobacterales bacterium]